MPLDDVKPERDRSRKTVEIRRERGDMPPETQEFSTPSDEKSGDVQAMEARRRQLRTQRLTIDAELQAMEQGFWANVRPDEGRTPVPRRIAMVDKAGWGVWADGVKHFNSLEQLEGLRPEYVCVGCFPRMRVNEDLVPAWKIAMGVFARQDRPTDRITEWPDFQTCQYCWLLLHPIFGDDNPTFMIRKDDSTGTDRGDDDSAEKKKDLPPFIALDKEELAAYLMGLAYHQRIEKWWHAVSDIWPNLLQEAPQLFLGGFLAEQILPTLERRASLLPAFASRPVIQAFRAGCKGRRRRSQEEAAHEAGYGSVSHFAKIAKEFKELYMRDRIWRVLVTRVEEKMPPSYTRRD